MLTHTGTRTLTTPRLTLRPFTPEDAQDMFDNWCADPEVTKYLTWPTHPTVDVTHLVCADWVSRYSERDYYQWAIVHEGQVAGSIAVVSHDDRIGKAEIGYVLSRKLWHRGIMTEALQTVMDYLFDVVGYDRLEARHDPRNPHSGGVMRKCGMRYEGTLRHSDRNNQGICDACWYALLKSERPAR